MRKSVQPPTGGLKARFAILLAGALPLVGLAAPVQAARPAVTLASVVPAPAEVHPRDTSFRLDSHTVIQAPSSARTVADRLAEALRPATGYRLPIVRSAPRGASVITL